VAVPAKVFDDDYLHFYAEALGDERSDADAQTIARLLGLEPGMRLLDAPCGEGRIAGRLARRGCAVVGLDSSARFIEMARKRHPQVDFEQDDLREMTYRSQFDAAVNWFTSFGYFDRATNDRVLSAFARALRPGGRLLIELRNPAGLRRLLELAGGTLASVIEKDGDLMVDRITYDEADRRSRTERWIVRGGEVRKLEFSLEQIPAPELVDRLLAAGFRDVELFGEGGARFESEGSRLIAVATV
jgi:SAM-dependent methyltransferase